MASDCKKNKKCGCEDQPLTIAPSCSQGTEGCPEQDPCPESFRAECVIWTGPDLICNSTVIATQGDRLPLILERVVAIMCTP
ncbi:hypothetical protein E6Q11_00415 [Candidatus Dojkabacteria bacterium]|uniref:Uncharacterized protein n=1 Tax=Candidatus Dojkabacteria bacterium TaxID=2099670 RepID=A0A5C7JB84_9BACT|nr:MAG: hypothetical protein E6Q11_00415 [Candidatus Dojkabacteria bacterium]